MDLLIDLRWLLERQAQVLPEHPEVHDYSGLVAAVARHRVDPPKIDYPADAARRAAALLHTLVLLRPLPARNALYASLCASVYMHSSGEGIDPPYGAMVEVCRAVQGKHTDVFQVADHIRSWRI
ncbi:hypothetical protein ABIA33_004807 [Streptacidiphilus sp. MAP12-16]|uniref:toxin Doc n=1 Tax=Streptacidiphilus sp. MAP12-16 TaxID=3156300 RepID=UPI003512CB0C